MMTEEEFRQALCDSMDEQIEADIAAYKEKYGEEEHVFSKEFEESMEHLFRTGKPKYRGLRSERDRRRRGRRRILAVAAAAVLGLTLTACAVPQIRESVAGFFVKVFGDHVEYTDPAVTHETIEAEYGLVPVPEGFGIVKTNRSDTCLITTYSDNDHNFIVLHQFSRSGIQTADNAHGTFSDVTIDGIPIRLYLGEGGAQASWIQDGYYFSLSYNSPVEQELFEKWIASVDKL